MNVKPIRTVFPVFLLFAGLALLQPTAFADSPQVTLTLLAPPSSAIPPLGNNSSAGNVYLSPYFFSVNNGTTTTIQALICDDFNDEITAGEQWTANVLTGSAIPPAVGLTGSTTQYEEIGYLANLLFQLLPPTGTSITDTTDQAALSFAIWDILDPTDVDPVVASDLGAAYANYQHYQTLETDANISNLSGLTIYQPVQTSEPGRPQQFIGFSMPEAPSPVILGFNLLVLLAAGLLVSRRVIRNSAALR